MKTNVSIKFNSIEEYREIERVLEGLGYVNDKEWNEWLIKDLYIVYKEMYFSLNDNRATIFSNPIENKTYNSLEEFLKD